MGVESDNPKVRWHLDMRVLRWVAIVLPILFLASLDVVRHAVFFKPLHTFPGFLAVHGVIAIAVVIFSYTIFGFIARLQRKIIDQNRQLSALNNIAKAATAKLQLEELLDASLDHILSNMQADAGLVCIVDMEKEGHSVVCHRGFSQELVRRIQEAKLQDDPLADEVVRTGRAVILERVLEDPEVTERARQEGIRSTISVPLKSEGEVNGILVIATHEERHFSDGDQVFLQSIGGQLGMAITNAILYEQAQVQNQELGALLAVSKAVTSSFDLDELLGKSLDTVIEVTSADAAEIWLLEGDDELALQCHRGANREAFLERTRFRVGEGIPGNVALRQEPVVIHDLASDASFLRQGVIKAGFHTFCGLPLRYQSRLMGVLTVAALSADVIVGKRSLRLLEGISEWLALAIENVRLYQQVQDVAVLQERERIAREMHDGMAQLLGYINTQTIAVKKLLTNGQLAGAREELTKMEDIARDLYADVREGILGLRSASGRQKGLLPALREYVERYTEMSGVEVTIEVSGNAEHAQLTPSIEIQLMRIVQEALTNVRKHSRATAAGITFDGDGDELRVNITDNGEGFELTRLPSRGWPRFGLQTMRERAEAVGGTLSIDTAPGQGTKVKVCIPLIQPRD